MRRTRLKPTAVLTIDPKPFQEPAREGRVRRHLALGVLFAIAAAAASVIYEQPKQLAFGVVTAVLDQTVR
jgi:hypothetical protein